MDHRVGDVGHALEIVGGAGGDRAEDELLGRAAAEQHRHHVDQLLAGLQVAVLVGQVERVAECAAAGDDRDPVYRVDRRQQLGAQRVAALVVGDDPPLVVGQRRRDCIPAMTRSSALIEVAPLDLVTSLRRAALIAASLQMLARSAPVRPEVWRASSAKSTVSATGLSREWTLRIRSRPTDVGRRDEDLAVEAPGAQQRRVELLQQVGRGDTTTSPVLSKPSISTSSWLSVWSCSLFPLPPGAADGVELVDEDDRRGVLARARNRRRIRAAPRPANISTNDDADCEKNVAPDSWATALASSVLPVPGGPWSRIPRDLGAEAAEAPGVAQVVDDLAQLVLGLVGAGDLVPGDRRRRLRADLLRAGPRASTGSAGTPDHQQPHEDDREPVVQQVEDVRVAAGIAERASARALDRPLRPITEPSPAADWAIFPPDLRARPPSS